MSINLKIKVHQTTLKDVLVIEPKVFGDERGWFYESFNQEEFNTASGLDYHFVQDNHSLSKQGMNVLTWLSKRDNLREEGPSLMCFPLQMTTRYD